MINLAKLLSPLALGVAITGIGFLATVEAQDGKRQKVEGGSIAGHAMGKTSDGRDVNYFGVVAKFREGNKKTYGIFVGNLFAE